MSVCVCAAYECGHVHACKGVCICGGQGLMLGVIFYSSLYFEAGFSLEPGACCLGKISWPAIFWDPLVHFTVLEFHIYAVALGFYVGAGVNL